MPLPALTRQQYQARINALREYIYSVKGQREVLPPDYGLITERTVGVLNDRVGIERVAPAKDWEHEDRRLTRTRIRTSAQCRQDLNPLFLDAAYAAKTPYGAIIAPPDALMMAEVINARGEGMPGMHALWQDVTFDWNTPIFAGYILTGKTRLADIELKGSTLSGQRVVQHYETIATNQHGRVVGVYQTRFSRHSRRNESGQEERGEHHGRPRPYYSPEDLEQLKSLYRAHERRGGNPRFWEDVNVGDELSTVIKGPTNSGQRLSGELIGSGSFGHTGFISIGSSADWGVPHGMVWDLYEKHPGLPIINSQGVPDHPFYIHLSDTVSNVYLGIAGGYDGGIQRIHWMTQLMLDWQSDYAFMRRLFVRFRGMTIQGETILTCGKVKGKRIDGDDHIVDVEAWQQVWGSDARPVTTAEAEIVLPSREGDINQPVKSRL